MKRTALAWAILGLLLAALGFGLVRLFYLRQAGGDLYPPYSSLRPDPMGIKALYLALEDLNLPVRRNFRPWRWLTPEPQTTWLFAGVNRLQFEQDWPQDHPSLEALARHGGRLIIAFQGELSPPTFLMPRLRRNLTQRQPLFADDHRPLEDLWQFNFSHQPLPQQDGSTYQPASAHRVDAPSDWPATLAWRSALCFTNVGPAWRVLYAVGSQPVLMERKLGAGTIVLMSDSFHLSNEALRFHRASPLLSWLVGQPAAVIFDEAHLGVVEAPTMGSLLRQYRLQGFAAVALLLALLYLWQNSFPLAPLPATSARAGTPHVLGRDTTLGLINLLRRGLPPRRLLRVCLEHWKDSAGRRAAPAITQAMEQRVAEFEQTPARLAQPLQVYLELSRLAEAQRRRRPTHPQT
ncbi:MAG: DUF4350 domain-containing protein [Verrucomicrobiae bacterium]|nr:DUF4350 domain-containing protein [Verrucomicrobiae bacterium]